MHDYHWYSALAKQQATTNFTLRIIMTLGVTPNGACPVMEISVYQTAILGEKL